MRNWPIRYVDGQRDDGDVNTSCQCEIQCCYNACYTANNNYFHF